MGYSPFFSLCDPGILTPALNRRARTPDLPSSPAENLAFIIVNGLLDDNAPNGAKVIPLSLHLPFGDEPQCPLFGALELIQIARIPGSIHPRLNNQAGCEYLIANVALWQP